MDRGRCPKCNNLIAAVNVDNVDIIAAGSFYNGVAYLCPHCDTVLAISMDQLGVDFDVLNKRLRALHKVRDANAIVVEGVDG